METFYTYRPVGNAFGSGAGGLRFKSRTLQIGHSVGNGSSLCNISSKGAVLPAGVMMRRWAPQTRYTLRRNTTNIMKGYDFDLNYILAGLAAFTEHACFMRMRIF